MVKATLFNKDHTDPLHNLIERVLTPEYLYFGVIDNYQVIDDVRKAQSLLTFDYKVYDELRQIKKEIKSSV